MTKRQRFLEYLHAYESKNIEHISLMFSEEITLRDWKISVSGKPAALFETRSNFSTARTIEIQPLRIFESECSIAAELKIVIDGAQELFVVDVVDFNKQGNIIAIRAFLGRDDA